MLSASEKMIRAQKLKEVEVTEQDSLLLTRKLLPVASFNISYIRGLFPDNYFNYKSDPALGVYDALQKIVPRTLHFRICEAIDRQEYAFSFSFSDLNGQEVSVNINRIGNKKQGTTFQSNQRELEKHIPDLQVLMSTPFHPAYVTAERIKKAKNLQLLLTAGIGSDHVDLKPESAAGLTVAEVTGSNTVSVAEDELMRILILVRNFLPGYLQVINGDWNVAAIAHRAYDLEGKTVGTVGAGLIGKLLLQLLKPFNFNLLYHDRLKMDHELENQIGAKFEEDVDAMLPKRDIVVINTPLTEKTKGTFNKERIAKMKKGVLIVNNARGANMDAQAVADACSSGHIAGYSGDVWYPQPAPKDRPWRYMPNQAMTPHISGTTTDAQLRYAAGTKDMLERGSACKMIGTLVQFMQTLHQMPEGDYSFLSIKMRDTASGKRSQYALTRPKHEEKVKNRKDSQFLRLTQTPVANTLRKVEQESTGGMMKILKHSKKACYVCGLLLPSLEEDMCKCLTDAHKILQKEKSTLQFINEDLASCSLASDQVIKGLEYLLEKLIEWIKHGTLVSEPELFDTCNKLVQQENSLIAKWAELHFSRHDDQLLHAEESRLVAAAERGEGGGGGGGGEDGGGGGGGDGGGGGGGGGDGREMDELIYMVLEVFKMFLFLKFKEYEEKFRKIDIKLRNKLAVKDTKNMDLKPWSKIFKKVYEEYEKIRRQRDTYFYILRSIKVRFVVRYTTPSESRNERLRRLNHAIDIGNEFDANDLLVGLWMENTEDLDELPDDSDDDEAIVPDSKSTAVGGINDFYAGVDEDSSDGAEDQVDPTVIQSLDELYDGPIEQFDD